VTRTLSAEKEEERQASNRKICFEEHEVPRSGGIIGKVGGTNSTFRS